MKQYKTIKISLFVFAATFLVASCTKLNEKLNSTLNSTDASKFSDLFLKAAYNDIGVIYEDPGNEHQIEEVSADECFVPIRGTDWFDGGYHVQLHLHNWTRSGPTSGSILEGQFTALNKLSYDATTVLGTDGTADQLAQARFLRALAAYQLLDLFGQFPLRQPGENLLNPAKVYSGDSAVQFLISELNSCITNLNPSNGVTLANTNAARALLMKVYLGRGAFNNLAAPVFADADMQQVITLGNAIINSGSYSYALDYFDIFNANNSASPEAIFSLPNQRNANKSLSSYPNLQNRWYATLHYNNYDGAGLYGQAGWNGFSTMGEFYNTFGVNGTTLTQTSADAGVDQRIGGRAYGNVTSLSGLKVGLLIGQQYNEAGQPLTDRHSLPLSFTNGSETPASIDVSLLPNLESVGIRVLKYTPDLTNGSVSYQNPGNYFQLIRYADVVLMVAEAKLRQATPDPAGALSMVNALRTARGAAALTTMALVNPTNVYDPNTLLAERGRELYWENQRRTDLIRFGVYNIAWRLKPADAGAYYIYPIPQDDLNANPNLLPNIQGSAY